jgi:hypothetical protein
MAGEFGPGEVYNRRVTDHLQTLLPDRMRPGDNYSFGGQTVLDSESNLGKPAGGTCRIKGYVGADGQITVLERSRVTSGEEVLWASRNVIRRTHSVGGPNMEPFRYHVRTEIQSSANTKSGQTAIDISEFTSKPVHGGREAQAAVLLAERIAVEKESRSATTSCCSLQDLPSFPRVVSKGWIGLDWQEINDLLGPEADTIAASVSLDPVHEAERQTAESKGIEIFTGPNEDLAAEVGDRTPANATRPHPWDDREDDRIPTELPDDVDGREAERKLSEMIDRIQRMQSGDGESGN